VFKPKWMLLLSCMSLVACTSTPPETKVAETAAAPAPTAVKVVKSYTKDTDKSTLICRKEKVLGSNRNVKVCKTIGQQQDERKSAEQMVNDRTLQRALGGGG
jgi:hypothetical protein